MSKPLIVPEYTRTGQIVRRSSSYAPTVPVPSYTIDVQHVLTTLIPGRIARANACALNGNDLFIANSSQPNDVGDGKQSQCIFKVPNYLVQGSLAMEQTFIFTLDGSDYVGMVFDQTGNLYAAEGNSQDNHIFRYTGTDKAYPGAATAALDNYPQPSGRVDMGNAQAGPNTPSYFANLAFDAAGNLWASDYRNHRLVVFDAANLGTTNTYHVLENRDAPVPVSNQTPPFNNNTSHLLAEPEGIDFDADGNLWVANNNDGGFGIQDSRTSLVKITPPLQAAVLSTGVGGSVKPTGDFFIYQVPNLDNDTGAIPQFGGLQVDREAKRIYVNEEVAHKGRGYDIETIETIGTNTAVDDLDIVSTNPGNGGIAVVNTGLLVILV